MNHFFSENFIFHESDIKSSHFYDHFTKLDKEYYQIESIRGILSPTGTGSIVFTKLSHGIMLENVVVTFSFNQKDGEIVINFPESELFQGKANKIRNNCNKLLEHLSKVKRNCNVSMIRIGYEPAFDNDTCFIVFQLSLTLDITLHQHKNTTILVNNRLL